MSTIDDLIRSDLTAFGEETATDIPDSAAALGVLRDGAPYRDDRPGAEARRGALLDQRLQELAFMPMARERVFVHRVSRAAAGGVAVLAVCVAALASMDTWTHGLVYAVFGRLTAPLTAALLGGAALAAYVAAGLIAERYYEHRMRAALQPSGEAHDDIEKLANVGPSDVARTLLDRVDAAGLIAERYYEHRMRAALQPSGEAHDDIEKLANVGPSDVARTLLDRVDAAAIALPLAGVIASGLLLGLLVFFSDRGHSALHLIGFSRGVLTLGVVAGVTAAVVLASAVSRVRRGHDSIVVNIAEHWATLVGGSVAVLIALWYASRTSFALHAYDVLPSHDTSLLLGGIGGVALLLTGAWLLLWLRRRERRRVG